MTKARQIADYYAATTTQVDGLTTTEVGGFLPGGPKSATFIPVVGTAYNCDFSSASWTVNLSGMTTPQLEQRIKLNCFGNNPPFLLGTVNGLANLYLDAGFSGELTYTGASWGWN